MKKLIHKILFSMFIVIALVVTAISASAVTTYIEFTGPSTIDDGQSTTFDAAIYSLDTPIDYEIALLDSNDNTIHIFDEDKTNDPLYEALDISVGQSAYSADVTYTIRLTAVDSRGDYGYSDLTLTVNPVTVTPPLPPVNPYPIASITTPFNGEAFTTGDTIIFAGYGTDDGVVVSHSWTSNIDGVLDSGNGAYSEFSTSSLSQGIHTITFTVTDNDGNTGSDTIVIGVEQSTMPVASITSPSDGQEFKYGDMVTFAGYGTDSNGFITSYQWTSDIDGNLGSTTAFSTDSLSAGTHTITFTVTDNDGNTNLDTLTINVKQTNAPVVSIITPDDEDDFMAGDAITFNAIASDTDGTITGYSWVSDVDGGLGTTSALTTSSLSNGRHTITVTAMDNDGLTATDSIEITVKALTAPTAVISRPNTGDIFDQGDTIIFDGSQSYDPDGWIVSYDWRSDKDGQLGTLAAISRDDLSLGRHYITLTVTDNDALQYTDTFTVWIIINPLTAPDVTINSPGNGATFTTSDQITFNGSAADNGNVVSYEWTSNIYGEIASGTGAPGVITASLPEGEHEITLITTDDTGLTGQDTVWITVTASAPSAPSSPSEPDEEFIQNSIAIKSINIPSGTIVSAGDSVDFSLRFENDGDTDLEDIKASAVIQELAVMDSVGPFDLDEGDEITQTLNLEIPDYASGEYVVRLTISSNNVHRIVHRFITVR